MVLEKDERVRRDKIHTSARLEDVRRIYVASRSTVSRHLGAVKLRLGCPQPCKKKALRIAFGGRFYLTAWSETPHTTPSLAHLSPPIPLPPAHPTPPTPPRHAAARRGSGVKHFRGKISPYRAPPPLQPPPSGAVRVSRATNEVRVSRQRVRPNHGGKISPSGF